MSAISPKVWVPTVLAIVVGALLWVLTGDKSALIVILTGLATGGIGAVAPHATGVSHAEVLHLARARTRTGQRH